MSVRYSYLVVGLYSYDKSSLRILVADCPLL
nr:MAG TPA_asm: hypothetical protein [Caudoviricetes sp.]DAL61303.1 MAG TPA_asm: hypothetical protein [Bacteriophage sp.]